jgi:serine/threonine-protein kinase
VGEEEQVVKQSGVIGGRYRLDSLLAEGGMGEVWRAHDELLGRDVAVKVLRTALVSDAVVAERFRREARAAASMSHPNMANVYDYIEEDAHPGIVMELVDGRTLANVIAREAPMDLARSAAIVDQMLGALEAAHGSGLVHRDVKPANVMIDERDHVKVADFGIARALGDSTLTDTGTVLGSVHYVSPEQLRGDTPHPASDLYAAGVILYEMLTGVRPFEGETPVAIAMSRLQNDPVPPRAHRPNLPAHVQNVIMRALARDPRARYASATEMRAALADAVREAQQAIDTLPLAASPEATTKSPVDATSKLSVDATTRLPTAAAEATTRLPSAATPEPAATRRRAALRSVRIFRPVLLGVALALLTIALVALALRPPAKVTVPSFKASTIEKARALADQRHLEIVVDRSEYDNAASGVVLSQTPAAGTVVKSGATVHVVVSKGPPPCCTVPDVVGMKRAEAEDAIERAGLEADLSFRVTNDDDPGTVIEQDPDPRTTLAPGEKVGIVVATAPEEDGKGKRKGREG